MINTKGFNQLMTLIKHMKRVGLGLILFVTISFSACGVKSGIDLNGKDLIKVEVKELQFKAVFLFRYPGKSMSITLPEEIRQFSIQVE